ncbi:hypothetical protein [Vibrio hippocampi]|uniref:DUF1289 domain-containing protein n=1 Tax=Vibrio hippocampi TaxID=654686 RepID=A0ABN8DFW2_9VIBR|nr:hypothetical protein [Vibrio hippocampi]CAH0525821.1 hypothetical protein VHP8226_01351 [Vibrio hippocampi]
MRTFSIAGVCDWCKKPSMVTKHEYVDGKCNHSCQECNDIATLDVRQFNLEELAIRAKHAETLLQAS